MRGSCCGFIQRFSRNRIESNMKEILESLLPEDERKREEEVESGEKEVHERSEKIRQRMEEQDRLLDLEIEPERQKAS